jgi:hypothetical protein
MKMHLSDQEIKYYITGDDSDPEVIRIAGHLVECHECQVRADRLLPSGIETSRHMSALAPRNEESAQPVHLAFKHFKQKYLEQESKSMLDKLFNRKYRFAWAAVGVVAFLAVAMLFPQVRAIGSSFLGLFRAEQFTIIQVDPEDIEEQLGSSSNFEYLLAEDVHVEEFGEMQEVSSKDEASDISGFQVRLPGAADGEPQLVLQPGARVSLLVDLPKVQALLDELELSDLKLPAELNGAEVSMELPVAVAAAYGTCEVSPEMIRVAGVDPDGPIPDLSKCITLTQFPSPELSAPPGLDIARIGQAFLQVLGMTPEEAVQFSQSVDWTTTLVIPIPRYGTEYQEVMVDGVEGTLIMQSQRSEFPHYLLIWIKDGIVYALTGPGDAQSAVDLANSFE